MKKLILFVLAFLLFAATVSYASDAFDDYVISEFHCSYNALESATFYKFPDDWNMSEREEYIFRLGYILGFDKGHDRALDLCFDGCSGECDPLELK